MPNNLMVKELHPNNGTSDDREKTLSSQNNTENIHTQLSYCNVSLHIGAKWLTTACYYQSKTENSRSTMAQSCRQRFTFIDVPSHKPHLLFGLFTPLHYMRLYIFISFAPLLFRCRAFHVYPRFSTSHVPKANRPATGGQLAGTIVGDSSPSADAFTNGLVTTHSPSNPIASITFLIPVRDTRSKFGTCSPVGSPSLREAVQHLCDKAFWFADGRVTTSIVLWEQANEHDLKFLCESDVLVAIGIDEDVTRLTRVWKTRRKSPKAASSLCHFALDCAIDLPALVGPWDQASGSSLLSWILPWIRSATARRLHDQMHNMFARWTSDDFTYGLMLFVNQFIAEVDWVKHSIDATWEKGPLRNSMEFYSMMTKCGSCILKCLRDAKCRECIGKLTEIDSRDQVQSYKTIVSYESDLLREFSLCILTKNNIFNCDATIPILPQVTPISAWRGEAITEEAGRSILVGHLNDLSAPAGSLALPVSWKVCCGANVAYDQFPSQNQLFYHAARGRDMWYDPVFRVRTLDGRDVWCKR